MIMIVNSILEYRLPIKFQRMYIFFPYKYKQQANIIFELFSRVLI